MGFIDQISFAKFIGQPEYDYFVDGVNGSDSNDGSSSSPWETTEPLVEAIEALGENERISALIKSATYDSNSKLNFTTGAAEGAYALVHVEENTIFQGDTGVDASWLNFTGDSAWTLEIVGLGLWKGPNRARVTGYDAGSGNAFGAFPDNPNALCIVRNMLGDDCVDGFSLHGRGKMDLYGIGISNCSKAAIAHVYTEGQARAFDSDFTGRIGATGGIMLDTSSGTPSEYNQGCTFTPVTAGQGISLGDAIINDGVVGTLTTRVAIIQTNGSEINNSFLNAFIDGNVTIHLEGCYGKRSSRHRNGGAITGRGNHWRTGASGSVNALWDLSFNPSANGSPHSEINSIVSGYGSNTIGSGATATTAGQFLAGNPSLHHLCFFGNTAPIFDADLEAAAGFDTAIHDNITNVDPLIGPCNTTNKEDWAIADNSPLVGAGDNGETIGFTNDAS